MQGCEPDCPSDEAEYIHRVGRTARIGAAGKALAIFLPSEELMIPLSGNSLSRRGGGNPLPPPAAEAHPAPTAPSL